MAVDNAKGGGKTGSEETLLEFTFDDSPEDPPVQSGKRTAEDAFDDIIELVNPIKKGEIPEDILEGLSSEPGGPSVKDIISEDSPVDDDLNSLDKEIAAIFSDQAPVERAPVLPIRPAIEDVDDTGPDKELPPGTSLAISEERLEAIVARAVNDAIERVARQAIEAAAERAIREAIDALRESLKVSSF